MNREEFVEMISIDEEGHYPFSLYVENKNNEVALCALALNDVFLVYAQVLKYAMESPEKIYFTLDFPASRDIQTDFVAVYFKEQSSEWDSVIIPYDGQGNRLERITSGEMFDVLLKQCKSNCRPLFKLQKSGIGN